MDATMVLNKLFEKGNKIDLPQFGKSVQLRKATLRTMSGALNFLETLLADLQLDMNNIPKVDLTDPGLLLKLISKYYTEVVALAVAHSDLTTDELMDMDADESLLVLQGVVILNKDFFMNKVRAVLSLGPPPPQTREPEQQGSPQQEEMGV
jgi:hypothetical protein